MASCPIHGIARLGAVENGPHLPCLDGEDRRPTRLDPMAAVPVIAAEVSEGTPPSFAAGLPRQQSAR